jgi:hypothetical protein
VAGLLWMTEDAVVKCQHAGVVQNTTSQDFVTVEQRLVQIQPDPQGRTIKGCPNYGPTIKPCVTTLPVQAGYSTFIRIAGKPVCLQTVWGLTDGTPPGAVRYEVADAGQKFVAGAA